MSPPAFSRLDSAIARLTTLRLCLDWAAGEAAQRPGPVMEFGLGNGRSYDHLRKRLPGRDIYVFDRHVAAHPACVPPAHPRESTNAPSAPRKECSKSAVQLRSCS